MIYNWTAKRSGAFITVEGFTDKGNAVKIGQVSIIEIDEKGPYATAQNGNIHRLATDTLPF
jgi:hypothetical protein